MRTATQWSRRFIGACVTVLALATACKRAQEPRPTPAAWFSTEQLLDSGVVKWDTVRDHLADLHFVKELGPSDLRHVDLEQPKSDTVKGALVWIQPEEGSHLLDDDWKQGRFIAQIWSDHPYPRLGLEPGWNWWWVGELRGMPQSVFVAERTGHRTPKHLDVVRHDSLAKNWYGWDEAIARLVPGTVKTWGTCGGACCQS